MVFLEGLLSQMAKKRFHFFKHVPGGALGTGLFIMNFILLVTHLLLGIFYYTCHSQVMIIANLFSILFYLVGVLYRKKQRFAFWGYAIYAEILAHVVLASVSLGWECGFQLWLIALVSGQFFTHIGDHKLTQYEYANAITISISVISFAFYLLLYILDITGVTEPVQANLSYPVVITAHIINSLMVFVSLLIYTLLFLKSMSKNEKTLSRMARHDSLTGLYNRYAMTPIAEKAFDNAVTYGKNFSIGIADIDFFKQINDTYGHDAGDVALKAISDLLLRTVTGLGDGYVCRWGGEEFLIVLPTDEHCMRSYMEEFRHKVAVMGLTYEKQRIDMTISVGFGTYEEGKTLQSLLREADENLYYVKEHGRNAVRP